MTAARESFQHSDGGGLQVGPRKLCVSVEEREKLLRACVFSRVEDSLQMFQWSVKSVVAWSHSVFGADTSRLPVLPGNSI